MDFKVEKKETPSEKHKGKYERTDIDLAYSFAKKIYKEFGHFVKAIVLFGSKRKAQQPSGEGDIDILLVVDDISFYLTPEVIEAYRVIVEKTIADVSTRLHITTLKFTSFWEYMRVGDPIAINILRDGVALLDTGFFAPLQMLLYQGRIRPTKESMIAYYSKAPQTMFNSRWHIMQATLDLYWAVIDAAHAAIMKLGELPPTPATVADVIDEKLAKPGYISKRSPKTMKKFYELSKKILHREIKSITGEDYEKYYKQAHEFIEDMKKFIEKP